MTTPITYLADHFTYEQRISPPPTAYGRTAQGYGSQIATDWLVRLSGGASSPLDRAPALQPDLDSATAPQLDLALTDLRWRRVYATCWSNAASFWVRVRGQRFYFRTFDLSR